MAKSFSDLKKRRRSIEDLQAKASKGTTKYESDDDRFWKPTADKSGNGSAVLRFLPAPAGEDDDWVSLYQHAFKNKKTDKWYIENSRTTIGEKDPVSELNSRLWATGTKANKDLASEQKRKLKYIANVYIVSDPRHPENNGTVRLFRFGPTIFDFIKTALRPVFEDEVAFDPFDLFEGANFNLRFQVGENKQRTYAPSKWGTPEPLSEDEAELERIWSSAHKLQPFVAPDQFKPYDVLKERLELVLMGGVVVDDEEEEEEEEEEKPRPARKAAPKKAIVEDEDGEDEVPVRKIPPKAAPKKMVAEETEVSKPKILDDDDDGFDFSSLVDDED
jgi:hypothetical protein